jgi:trk system potassium uptake protein TrkA
MEQSNTSDGWDGPSVTKTPGTTVETLVVVGGDHVGTVLTEQLDARGEPVMFLDEDTASVERALDGGLTAIQVDFTDRQAFDDAGINDVTTAFVAAGSDSQNLLTAQKLAVRFGIDRIVVRMNDPRNHLAFEDRGFETVSATNALAAALAEAADPTA